MKNWFFFAFIGSLSFSSFAKDIRPLEALKNLEGCFEVTYRFVEVDKPYFEQGFEEITYALQEDGTHFYQHFGVFGGERIKHWGEQWAENSDGTWTQTVVGPSGDFRYKCTAAFEGNQWRCHAGISPKPRRDKSRTDYDVIDRENTLQFSPQVWIQSERNFKKKRDLTFVSAEVGWNEYRRVDSSKCSVQ